MFLVPECHDGSYPNGSLISDGQALYGMTYSGGSQDVGVIFKFELQATLLSPLGTISTNIPAYTWNAVPSSTWYLLYVNDSSGNPINQWYRASDADCAGCTGVCSVTPDILVEGAAKWWIQTWNAVGYGP